MKLSEEVNNLKQQIQLNSMLADQPNSLNISQARIEQLQRLAGDYLRGQESELGVMSFGNATITLDAFKGLFAKQEEEKEQLNQKIADLMMQVNEEPSFIKIGKVVTTQGKRGKKSAKREESPTLKVPSSSETQLEPTDKKSYSVVKVNTKSGGSISGGRPGEFEGTATRALKRHRTMSMIGTASRKSSKAKVQGVSSSDSLKISKEQVILESQESLIEDDLSLPMLPLPEREEAWEEFTNKKTELVEELQSNIREYNELAKHAHKDYLTSTVKLVEIKAQLDIAKTDLAHEQHLRHLKGEETYDPDGRIAINESELLSLENVKVKEAKYQEIQEKVLNHKMELEENSQKYQNSKQILEDTFQAFCTGRYKAPLPFVETSVHVISVSSVDEIVNQKSKEFQHFQRTLLKKEEPRPRKI